jgi:copper(I)-binding protein
MLDVMGSLDYTERAPRIAVARAVPDATMRELASFAPTLMQPMPRLATLIALLLVTSTAAAADVRVEKAWARQPAPGQKTASAYAELTSTSAAALVAAASPLAGRVELHSMTLDGGVMRMRAISRIELPAGKTVKLAPNGLHLMVFDLKQPLKAGDKLPLVLTIQPAGASATTLEIEAEVRAAAGGHAH